MVLAVVCEIDRSHTAAAEHAAQFIAFVERANEAGGALLGLAERRNTVAVPARAQSAIVVESPATGGVALFDAAATQSVPAKASGAQLKAGDVMTYREYLRRRTRGSSLRGHHTPQAARLEELGIDPMEGTVVVIENRVVGPAGEKLGHTGTRTHGAAGRQTAASERGKPLGLSETLDLLDPPVERLGPEVGDEIQRLNRMNFPERYEW